MSQADRPNTRGSKLASCDRAGSNDGDFNQDKEQDVKHGSAYDKSSDGNSDRSTEGQSTKECEVELSDSSCNHDVKLLKDVPSITHQKSWLNKLFFHWGYDLSRSRRSGQSQRRTWADSKESIRSRIN